MTTTEVPLTLGIGGPEIGRAVLDLVSGSGEVFISDLEVQKDLGLRDIPGLSIFTPGSVEENDVE